MSEHAGTYEALAELHAVDQKILAAEGESHRTPVGMERDGRKRDELVARLGAVQAEVGAVKERQRAAERDLSDVEGRRERARRRIPNLTTSAQIDATEREITDLSRQASEIEERVLVEMEAADALQVQRAELDRGIQAAGADLQTRGQAWVPRQMELEAELAELRPARALIVPRVPPEPLRMYSLAMTDRRFALAGITVVDHGTCVTCHQRPPPLWVQEAKIQKAVHACQNCKRVLFPI